MLKYKYLVALSCGDLSCDGHEKEHTQIINSNFSHLDIKSAYVTFVEKTNIDLLKYCSEYEDNAIPYEVVQKFANLSEEFKIAIGDLEEDCDLTFDCYDWLDFYLMCIEYARPEFEYEKLNIPFVDCGGYGLFN